VDRRPSCDVDLERGWICRSCGRGGGLLELAELLGVMPSRTRSPDRRRSRVPPPPPGLDAELWREAWLEVLVTARRQSQRLEPWLDVFVIADWLRRRRQFVRAAQRLASTLGDDSPRAWRLLAFGARVATEAAGIEAELDEVLPHVA
jgi:hypothetical protein